MENNSGTKYVLLLLLCYKPLYKYRRVELLIEFGRILANISDLTYQTTPIDVSNELNHTPLQESNNTIAFNASEGLLVQKVYDLLDQLS